MQNVSLTKEAPEYVCADVPLVLLTAGPECPYLCKQLMFPVYILL